MEAGGKGSGSVCVTGASGFIGSWLVMNLLQRGYHVRATVRDPRKEEKVKHLLDLPKAATHLTLWRADLKEEGSFDDAIQGCSGVFHVASPMDLWSQDPQNEIVNPTVNGVLDIIRACVKAKTVKRLIYTSTTGTITYGRNLQPPPLQYDESFWSDVENCTSMNSPGQMYLVAKMRAEKAAWEYAGEHNLDLVTIHPPAVMGPFNTPTLPLSATAILGFLTGDGGWSSRVLGAGRAVHVDDLCSAHIYLFERPEAQGRYICASHCFNFIELARSLSRKYPDYDIPTRFEGMDESLKPIPCSSRKLLELGYKFNYNSEECEMVDLCSETIESCREKGLLPPPNKKGSA